MPNARALSIHLDQELARCKREHSSVAVMVCDLDGFKLINDLYGHLAGDKVLRLFSNLMQDVCREYDYVARMGGDEFMAILEKVEGRQEVEALAIDLIAWLKMEMVCLFAWMQWSTVEVARHGRGGLSPAQLPVFLVTLFGTLAWFIAAMRRAGRAGTVA